MLFVGHQARAVAEAMRLRVHVGCFRPRGGSPVGSPAAWAVRCPAGLGRCCAMTVGAATNMTRPAAGGTPAPPSAVAARLLQLPWYRSCNLGGMRTVDASAPEPPLRRRPARTGHPPAVERQGTPERLLLRRRPPDGRGLGSPHATAQRERMQFFQCGTGLLKRFLATYAEAPPTPGLQTMVHTGERSVRFAAAGLEQSTFHPTRRSGPHCFTEVRFLPACA